MADYIPIDNSEIAPDAPITAGLGSRWRDNPIAITEGAAGAPRIQDAALSTTVTAAGRNWVGARYADIAWNGVGATVQAVIAQINTPGTTAVQPGEEVSGALLAPAASDGYSHPTITLPGTWICAGFIRNRNQTTIIERTADWRRVR